MNLKQIEQNVKIAEDILFNLLNQIQEGMSVFELNWLAKREFKKYEVIPSPKAYYDPIVFYNFNKEGYLSIALNESLIFGEIGNKKIKNGDLVNLGIGVFNKGFFADIGASFLVGKDKRKEFLLKNTAKSIIEILDKIKDKKIMFVKDLSSIIEKTLKKYKITPICEIAGHGLGMSMYIPPFIPNCLNIPNFDYNMRIKENSIFTLEIVSTLGNGKIIREKRYSYKTVDNEPVASFEIVVLFNPNSSDPIKIISKRLVNYIKTLSVD